jgi:hypothetical protein
MPSSFEIADWVSNHFAANQLHTANILAGPKRETWFSAETFVALCSASRPLKEDPLLPEFSCWGEEQFATIFKKVSAKQGIGDTGRKPDIVCYLPKDGDEAIDAILELKLVLNSENPISAVNDLKAQMNNARGLSSNSKVLGLIFYAAAPYKTPGTFDKSTRDLRVAIEQILPDAEGFAWVAGHETANIFRTVYTTYHYPSMVVSLALAVRELTIK